MNRRTRSAPGPRAQRVTRTGAMERFGPSAVGEALRAGTARAPVHGPNSRLVTGDLQKLIPSVTLFSISSYQLPVTSYQSKRFMAAEQVRKEQGALHAIEGEPSPNSDQRTEVLRGYVAMGGRA